LKILRKQPEIEKIVRSERKADMMKKITLQQAQPQKKILVGGWVEVRMLLANY